MFNKCAAVCKQRYGSSSLRWIRQIQSASYLHNPGSEPLTMSTLGEVLAKTAHKYPNRVAVKSLHENITLTYEELLTQADSFGCALRAQGLKKGDRLGLWAHNSALWTVALVGAARAGIISVLINPVFENKELAFCIKKTGVKSLLIGNQIPKMNYYNALEKLVPELHTSKPGDIKSQAFPDLTSVISIGKEKLDGVFVCDQLIEDYRNNNEITKYGAEVKPEEGCLLHFTSGTTGEPKAALDSHLGVVNNTYFTGKRNFLHEEHHNICVQAPLFHALGSIVTLLSGFSHGASTTLASPTYNVDANLNALISEKCSIITGTPTMYVDMLAKLGSAAPPRLKIALAAGAPCSPQLIKDMNKYMKTEYVKALYGLTEATACVFQSLPEDSVNKVAETVGYLTDHVECKVVDKDGNMVPFGSPGELLIRGYCRMIGYWDEPEKTAKAIDKDGWISSGDKFVLFEDGYGNVVGRIKDIIVRGGENIAPKEIEDLLNTHPAVLESQVIGMADTRLGEELCAVVRLREGASFTVDDMRKQLTGHLAKFKIPRILKITDDFPKTTSGKIQKFKLKDLVDSGKL